MALCRAYGSPNYQPAFTLTELLCVLGIIALLTAIAIPVIGNARGKSAQTACLSNVHQFGLAFAQYTQDYDGAYPPVASAEFTASGHSLGREKSWHKLLQTYLGHAVLYCPARRFSHSYHEHPYLSGYAMNYHLNAQEFGGTKYTESGKNETIGRYPALTISLFEARGGIIAYDRPDTNPVERENADILTAHDLEDELNQQTPGAIRHNGRANYAFLDGHVQSLAPKQISTSRHCEGVRPCFGL